MYQKQIVLMKDKDSQNYFFNTSENKKITVEKSDEWAEEDAPKPSDPGGFPVPNPTDLGGFLTSPKGDHSDFGKYTDKKIYLVWIYDGDDGELGDKIKAHSFAEQPNDSLVEDEHSY